MRRIFVLLASLLILAPAWAAPDNALPSLGTDPAPPVGPEAAAEAAPQPEVTIRRRGEATVEEYRLGSQLYMIRVIPQNGPPYYLVDVNGDGFLETRQNELDPRFLIPSWTILRW